ncbi:MAG: hypothetical protein JXA41_06765 [Deltaproteobacteria bacterium]|nr:hypothetical protein [Deltaproteobacteria bacterium]
MVKLIDIAEYSETGMACQGKIRKDGCESTLFSDNRIMDFPMNKLKKELTGRKGMTINTQTMTYQSVELFVAETI